jgi:hypothetical protein
MSRHPGPHPRTESLHRGRGRPLLDESLTPKRDLPLQGLALPRTDAREPVEYRHHRYDLNAIDARVLATVGTFRVVPATDLDPRRPGGDVWNGTIRQLAEQGLVDRKTVMVNHQPTSVVVLTREGKTLLDAKQEARLDGRRQQYHAGLVKPRELGHDSQLYRLYQVAAARIEADGGRIERVVLDYELKRDYQTFLNRQDREDDDHDDLSAFAAARDLPIIERHLELPDLRIEYETPDGRLEHRDVELVTEHYSRAQLAGKAQAGFSRYRAAGSGRLGSGGSRQGGTPIDPHHLEWLG